MKSLGWTKISEYVQIEQAAEGITPSRQFDISKIDFDLLRREWMAVIASYFCRASVSTSSRFTYFTKRASSEA